MATEPTESYFDFSGLQGDDLEIWSRTTLDRLARTPAILRWRGIEAADTSPRPDTEDQETAEQAHRVHESHHLAAELEEIGHFIPSSEQVDYCAHEASSCITDAQNTLIKLRDTLRAQGNQAETSNDSEDVASLCELLAKQVKKASELTDEAQREEREHINSHLQQFTLELKKKTREQTQTNIDRLTVLTYVAYVFGIGLPLAVAASAYLHSRSSKDSQS